MQSRPEGLTSLDRLFAVNPRAGPAGTESRTPNRTGANPSSERTSPRRSPELLALPDAEIDHRLRRPELVPYEGDERTAEINGDGLTTSTRNQS